MNEISQITIFAGVKFLARKFDCVKSWTNIMSAVIVVHLIKIQTMFRSKVRPFRANKAPDVNKTKGLKRKIKMSEKRKVSFYFCMWSLPLATTLFPMPPVSWLSIWVRLGHNGSTWVRGQDNMKTEPQWWKSSSCPSLS